MQSNADRELELEGAGCEEKIGMMQRLQGSEGYRNMARKGGRRERGKTSLGSHQGPLMMMRDGVQRKGLINPCIIWFLKALGGISG